MRIHYALPVALLLGILAAYTGWLYPHLTKPWFIPALLALGVMGALAVSVLDDSAEEACLFLAGFVAAAAAGWLANYLPPHGWTTHTLAPVMAALMVGAMLANTTAIVRPVEN